jgi:hypothetical protein
VLSKWIFIFDTNQALIYNAQLKHISYLAVRGSARYPPIASHFCWASTQDRLTAASRNLKHPSSSASSQPPEKITLQKKSNGKLIIYFRRYGCCFFGAVTKMRNMYSRNSACEITLLNSAFTVYFQKEQYMEAFL